jgi:hypothetical protein
MEANLVFILSEMLWFRAFLSATLCKRVCVFYHGHRVLVPPFPHVVTTKAGRKNLSK